MKVARESLLLYAVTETHGSDSISLAAKTAEAVRAGASFIQIRGKELTSRQLLQQACEIRNIASRFQVPWVINDNVEVALDCSADGVHVGQKDMPAREARSLIGKDKILGVSVQTVEQAISAEQDGADYLGVGSVFSTSTKLDAEMVSLETLKKICVSVNLPVVAIGGINKDNVLTLTGSGIAGIAVISAIYAQQDIFAATRELYQLSSIMVSP